MVAPAQQKAFRLAAGVTALNVVVASGFAIAGLVRPEWILPAGAAPSEASFLFALYAAARTLPLALMALAAIYWRSARALLVLGALAGVVQLVDGAIGLVQHDAGKTIGPLIIAALQFAALARLARLVGQGR